MLQTILAICLGASAGAVLRWLLGEALNGLYPNMPLGTLAANLAGGYLAGLALCLFIAHPQLEPRWRLLVITGFLGALTTFSAFSLEVVTLIQQRLFLPALGLVAMHVAGTLVMTFLGMASYTLLERW